jgi:hypothetical protein
MSFSVAFLREGLMEPAAWDVGRAIAAACIEGRIWHNPAALSKGSFEA